MLHNLYDGLNRGEMPASLNLFNTPAGYILAYGATVPADATAGYAPGCLFIHIDGTGYNTVLYCNVGSVTDCDFNVVTVAS